MQDLVHFICFAEFLFSKNTVFIILYFFSPFLLQRDVMADANIFQGAIFHEDNAEDTHGTESAERKSDRNNGDNISKPVDPMAKQTKSGPKPAAHRV